MTSQFQDEKLAKLMQTSDVKQVYKLVLTTTGVK